MTPLLVERRLHKGFATFTAVVMLMLVGIALLSLTVLFQDDSRRTMRHSAELQLRQLLIAGAVAAEAQVDLQPDPAGPRTLPMPDGYEATQVEVTYLRQTSSTIQATVSASLEGYEAEQQLSFNLNEAGWVLVEAQLTRQH